MEIRNRKIISGVMVILFLTTIVVFVLIKTGIEKKKRELINFKQQERIIQEQKDEQEQEVTQVVDNIEKTQDQEPVKTIKVEGTVSAVKNGVVEVKNGDKTMSVPLSEKGEIEVVNKIDTN